MRQAPGVLCKATVLSIVDCSFGFCLHRMMYNRLVVIGVIGRHIDISIHIIVTVVYFLVC